MLNLDIKVIIGKNGLMPQYAHNGDSGADIFSAESYILDPNETHATSTDLRVEIPYGYELQIRSKSGLAAHNGIHVLNSPATIDSTYRNEVFVILHNSSHKYYNITKGQKIAQFVLTPVLHATFNQTEEILSETARNGGLGSTGLYYAEGSKE